MTHVSSKDSMKGFKNVSALQWKKSMTKGWGFAGGNIAWINAQICAVWFFAFSILTMREGLKKKFSGKSPQPEGGSVSVRVHSMFFLLFQG